MADTLLSAASRPERLCEPVDAAEFGIVEKPLSAWENVWNQTWLRKVVILILLASAWEIYGRVANNELILPPFSVTIKAFFASIADGELPVRVWASLKILSLGYAMGVVLAGILTTLAITTRIGNDFLETLTSMFNPLPAIALLPLALLWFGLKPMSLAIVLIHSVLWPVALNTHAGFVAVSPTMRMVGRNYGLRGVVYVVKILISAPPPLPPTGADPQTVRHAGPTLP